MNAKRLNAYLTGLGQSHDELVSGDVIPPGDFIEVYPGALSIYRELMPGLELRFWAEDQNFESVMIALAETATSKVVYQQGLPEPYDMCVSRKVTLNILGEPIESKGPHKMPSPLGESGGWDKFDLASFGFENIYVLFEYDVGMNVTGLMFSLKKTGYDRSNNELQQQADE
ncbi:DUF6392 family protein [Pseudomonas alloputida]|uniref:DUF6392 family protein n=1 Tax=Pseudomonas TaxID=286 RepID=UPI003EEBF0CD